MLSAKAIVFSQFWMHLQLIAAHLTRNRVEFALLKRDLQHRTKQEAIAKFQVGLSVPTSNGSSNISGLQMT